MKLRQNRGTIEIFFCDIDQVIIIIVLGERIMKVPSFDELDADQLKELIQTSKKPVKKPKKLPLKEEKNNEKSKSDGYKLEVLF
jgi:hypothetical protein